MSRLVAVIEYKMNCNDLQKKIEIAANHKRWWTGYTATEIEKLLKLPKDMYWAGYDADNEQARFTRQVPETVFRSRPEMFLVDGFSDPIMIRSMSEEMGLPLENMPKGWTLLELEDDN